MKEGRTLYHFNHKTHFLRWILTIACLAFCYPALFNGCSSSVAVTVPDEVVSVIKLTGAGDRKNTEGNGIPHNTDIFVFNDDALRRLDSYQKIPGDEGLIASRSGDKIVVAVSDAGTGKWTDIMSLEGLYTTRVLLEEENQDCPVSVGMTRIRAGTDGNCGIRMRHLVSEIRITGLRTDFFGTEYEGEPLTDVRVYLTNISGSCPVRREEFSPPEMILNAGRLDEADLERFKDKSLVFREAGEIGRKGIPGEIRLYCYPSDHSEESAGSPFTRLVIEGKIRGHTCYYPLTVNRNEILGTMQDIAGDAVLLGKGISAGRRYDYDITVCREGTDDPDKPVEGGMVRIEGRIVGWEEIENETIVF